MKHRAAYLLGALGLVVGLAAVPGTTIVGFVLAGLCLLLGGAGVFLDWRSYRDSVASVHLRPAANVDIQMVGLPEQLQSGGYQLRQLGSGNGRAATSEVVNQSLRSGWNPRLQVIPRNWRSPVADADTYAILREVSRGGTVLTNDRKIALRQDLLPDLPEAAMVAQARYFDTVVTNDMFGFELTRRGSVVVKGRELCATTGMLDLLSDSQASNHIGVSVLSLSPDGLLTLSEQGNRSAQEAQRLAPTGSGSVDWSDVEGAETLLGVCRAAAAREFEEETSIPLDPSSLIPIGYARLMPRGGKPEFFFLAEATASKSEFVVRTSERGLTAGHEFFRLEGDNPARKAAALRRLIAQLEGRCSAVLIVALEFLAEYLEASQVAGDAQSA